MEAQSTMSMLFLLVLSISVCCWSLPAPLQSKEDALSSQKSATKSTGPAVHRSRRQDGGLAPPVTPDIALANATGPQLIKDIFINMTNSTANVNSQANVIRSLQYSPKVPKCDEFNFTLTAIDSEEFILQADLHLWLNIYSPPQQDIYNVEIKTIDSNGIEGVLPMRFLELKNSQQDHYVKFHVTSLLQQLSHSGAKSAVFKVSIYKDIVSYQNKEPYGCGQDIKFAYEDFTAETMPTLIVESRDPRIDQIDFQAIANKVDLPTELPPTEPPMNNYDVGANRRKRETPPPCSVQPLVVSTTSNLFKLMVEAAAGTSDFEILYPVTFDIGTCGGVCDSGIPFDSPSNHAPLLDFLLRDGTISNPGSYYKCCVPVKYRSLRIYVNSPSIAIVTIENIIVDTCECLDVLSL